VGLYSYIVVHDGGFSPNPFHGMCTLACCKPGIRRSAVVGDLVVGLTSCSRMIVYAMKVERIVGFTEYWNNEAYRSKRPDFFSPHMLERCGDNIYAPDGAGKFRQLPSLHSFRDGTEDPASKERDLRGDRVLVATEFVYFGADGASLPESLAFLKAGRGYRHRFTDTEKAKSEGWFSSTAKGVRGRPALWPTGDQTWNPRSCSPTHNGPPESDGRLASRESVSASSCSVPARLGRATTSDCDGPTKEPAVHNSRCSQS
jgi:Nucleotide modification associated domain 2